MASDEAHSKDADVNTLDTLEDAEDPILLAENPTDPGDPNGETIGETGLELEDETENTPEQGNTTENTNRDRPFIDANPIFNPAFFSSDRGTAFNLMLKAIFGTPLDPKEQQDLASILSKLGVSPGTSFRDIFEPTQIFPTEDDVPAPPSLTIDVSGPTSFNLLTAITNIPGIGTVTPAVLANILMGQPSVTIPTPYADVTIDAAGNVTIVPNAGIIPFDDGETAMTTVNIPLALPDGTIFNLPLNLNIAGMNDDPIIDQGDGPLAIIIAENQPGPVLQITATDPDTNDTVAFSLQDDFGGLFTIDPNTGQISTTGLDNESMSMFELVVIASDGTATDTIKINVTVTDVNDAPVLASIGNQALNELGNLVFTATATDQDVPPNALTFSLDGGAPTGATITTAGLFSWSPTEAQGPGVYNITVRVTDDGTPSLSDFETITVTVNEVNTAPILGLIGDQVINELSTFSFKANATDADSPSNGLTFSLDAGAPIGASINANTGIFSWTPSEAQGPGSYNITIRVTDDGNPALSDFETINILVNEVVVPNTPPVLGAIGNKAINELTPLSFTATATDSDLPANTLTFSLEAGVGGSVPAGASINPTTGEFSWTPTEAQGPGVYTFNIKVSDGISSDSETITVNVAEVNQAPVLAAIGDKVVAELTPLNFTVLATDSDLPGDTLTFSLDPGAPAGTSIDPTTGVFSWIPTDAQGPGNYNITVRVTDSGSLFDTETISVVVNEINPRILDLLSPNGDLSFTGSFPPLTLQNIASQDAKALANGTDFSIEGGQYKVDVSGNVPGTGSRTFQGIMADFPTTILLQLDTAQDGPDGFFNVRLGTPGADTSTVALRATDSQGNVVQGFDGEDVLFTGPGDDVLIGDGVGVTSASDTFIYEYDTITTFGNFGNDILPDFDQTANSDQLVVKGDLLSALGTPPSFFTDPFPSFLGASNNAILLALFSSVSLTLEGYKWQYSEGLWSELFGNSFGTALLPNLTSNTLQVGLDNDANGTVDETFTYFLGDNNDNAITPSVQNHLVFGFGGDDMLSIGSNSFFGILIGDNFGTSLTPQGNDILEGGTEADILIGDGDSGLTQKGNDVLFGREMDDQLIGDSFTPDTLSELSKSGNDVFVYSYDLDNGMDTILVFDQTSITGAQDSLGLINFPNGTLDRIETRSLPINFTSPELEQIEFNIVGADDSNNPLGVNLGGAAFTDLRLLELGNTQTLPDPLRIPIHFSTTGDLNDFKNIPPGMADAEVFLGTNINIATNPPTFEVIDGSATSDGLSAQFFFGFGGADLIVGGSGIDYIDGGDNADFLFGEGDPIGLSPSLINPTVLNSANPYGNDRIFGGSGDDSIWGDAIATVRLSNQPHSVGGDDLINGGAGNDTLFGDTTNSLIDADLFKDLTGIEFNTSSLSPLEILNLLNTTLEDLSNTELNTRLGTSGLSNEQIRSLLVTEDEAFGGTDRFVYDTAFDNGNDTIADFELNKDILVITNDLGRGNPDLEFILPDFAIENGVYVFKLLSGPLSQNFAQTVNHGTATLENITPEANSIVKTQIELTHLDPSESNRITDADATLGTDGDDSGLTTLNETNFIFGLGGNDFLTPADSSLTAILVGDNLFLNNGTTPAGNDTLVGGSGTDLLIGDGVQTLSGQPSGNDILFGKGGQDLLIGDGQKVNPTDTKGSDVFVYDQTIDNGFNDTLMRFDLKTTPTAPFDTIRIIGTSDEGLQALAQSLTFATLDSDGLSNIYLFGIIEGGGLPLLNVNLDQTLRGTGLFTKEDNALLTATTSVRLMVEVTAGSDPTQVGTPYEVILGTNSLSPFDTLQGTENSNAIWGLNGDDILIGGGFSSNPNDLLVGGLGDDELYGDGLLGSTGVGNGETGGDDILDGGVGDDLLVGDGDNGGDNATGGNDILVGGFGSNTLWGDFIKLGSNVTGGDDIFVVDRQHGGGAGNPNIQDIMDFGVGNDTLRIINATGADRQEVVDILQGFTVNTTGTPFYQLMLPSATPGNLPQEIRFTNLAVLPDTRVNFEFVTSGNHFESGEAIEVVFGTHFDDTGASPIFGNVDANQADQIIFGFDGTNTIWGDAYNDPTAVIVEGGSLPIGILLTTQGGNDIIIGGDGNDNIGGDSGILFGTEAKGGDDFIFGGGGANVLAGDSLFNSSGTVFNSVVINSAVGGADVFLFDAATSIQSQSTIIDFNFMNAPGKEDSIRIFNFSPAGAELDFSDIHDQMSFFISGGLYRFSTEMSDGTPNNVVTFSDNLPIPAPGAPYPRIKFEFSTDENFFTVDKTYDVILGTTLDDSLIIGTTLEDEIIYGLAGADIIFGDTNANLSTTGSNDLIDGGEGEDILSGDANDIVSGGTGGNDIIYGGDDNDTIQGDALTIDAQGKGGDDTLFGEDGDDIIMGDAAHNFGMGGNDTLMGGEGDDTLYGDGDPTLAGPNAIGGSDTFVYDLSIDNGTDTIGDFEAGDENNPSKDRIRLQNVAASDPDNPTLEELYAAIRIVELGFNTSGEYQIYLNDAGAGLIKFAGLEMAPDTRMTFELDTGTDGVDAEFDIFLASDSTSADLNTNTIGGLGSQIIYAGLNFDQPTPIIVPSFPSLDPNYTVYGDLPTLSADGSDDIIVLNPFNAIFGLSTPSSSEVLNIYGDGENLDGFMGGRDIFVWNLRNPDNGDLSGVQSFLRDFQAGMDGLESHDKIRVENLDNLTDLQNSSSPEATWNNVELAQVLNFDILGNLGNGNRYLIDDYTGIGFIELSNITPTAGTTVTFQLDSGTNGIDPNESEVNVILGTNESDLGEDQSLYGFANNEIIIGFGGNDRIFGDVSIGINGLIKLVSDQNASQDVLYGGAGNDKIYGDGITIDLNNDSRSLTGDDYLIGGLGDDELTGDNLTTTAGEIIGPLPNSLGGTDRFVYDLSQEFGNDVINDFQTANIADGPGAISKDRLLLQSLPNLSSLPALLAGVEDLVMITNAGNYLFTWFSPDSTIELLNVAPEAGSIVTLELASNLAKRLTPGQPINVVLGTNNDDNEGSFSLLHGDPESQLSGLGLQAIFGLDGDDQITGDKITVTSSDNPSMDIIVGGKGLDELVGDGFTIFSGSVVDEAAGDFIFGGDDGDEIVGDIRDNGGTLTNGGDDKIFGGAGPDILIGDISTNNGTLTAAGDNEIYGGPGNDLIYPSVRTGALPVNSGSTFIDGGDDTDTVFWRGLQSEFLETLQMSFVISEIGNPIYIGETNSWGYLTLANIEKISIEQFATSTAPIADPAVVYDLTQGENQVAATHVGLLATPDFILGGDGGDTIFGGLEATSGFSTILFSTPNDILLGGRGFATDKIIGDVGTVQVNDPSTQVAFLSGTGSDIIMGEEGNDILIGDVETLGPWQQVGNNVIGAILDVDSGGSDTIYGGEGDDTIVGDVQDASGYIFKAGDDNLIGGSGDDFISGDVENLFSGAVLFSAGNDRIEGGLGNDTLAGDVMNQSAGSTLHRGSDTFVFDFDPLGDSTGSQDNVSDSFGDDRIKDFIVGEDKLEFLNTPDFLGSSLDDLNALADLGFESFNGQDVLKVEFNQNTPTIDRGSIVFESILYNPLNSDFTDYFTLGDVVASN